jgi:hypothetical protein
MDMVELAITGHRQVWASTSGQAKPSENEGKKSMALAVEAVEQAMAGKHDR